MEAPARNLPFSVVVPAYNESENLLILIPRLYAALKSLPDPFELIIVNNASKDATKDVIANFQKSMPELRTVLEPQLGYGRAVLCGLRATQGDYIGIIRADNQEKPEDLARMYLAIKGSSYQLYKGIRLHRINDGFLRVVVSFFFNTLAHVLFGLKSKDLNATPKIFTRAFYEAAHLESLDWFVDAEIVIKVEKLGYKVGEMGIEYLPRLKGKSSVRPHHVAEFLRNMFAWHSRMTHGKLLES